MEFYTKALKIWTKRIWFKQYLKLKDYRIPSRKLERFLQGYVSEIQFLKIIFFALCATPDSFNSALHFRQETRCKLTFCNQPTLLPSCKQISKMFLPILSKKLRHLDFISTFLPIPSQMMNHLLLLSLLELKFLVIT